ncbi:hypothetical protein [Thermopetrobacter sp. TC1]|uniref:hypothetical protein n=1 Tax=Thermopetrobacter sp. TC1 TaxID=1495045 RepID=UPI00056EE445|nr:hypothetical protein [Thermopetrobacter sp. TC1]
MKWFGRRSKSEEIIEEVEALASSSGTENDEPVVAQPETATPARPVAPQPISPQPAGPAHGGFQGNTGPMFGAARDQFNQVMRENVLLREENARLKEQVRQLQMMLANMQAAANYAAAGMCAPAVPPAYAQAQAAMPQAQPMPQQPMPQQPMAQAPGYGAQPQPAPQAQPQPQPAAPQGGGSDDLRAMLAELKNEIAQVKQMASTDPYLARAGMAQPMAAGMAPQFGMASAAAGNGGEDVRAMLAELKSDIEALRAEQRSAAKRSGSEDLRDMLARLKEDIRSLKESTRAEREETAPRPSSFGRRESEAESTSDNVVHRLISDIEQGLGVQKADEETAFGKAEKAEPEESKDDASAKARDELADQLEQMLAKLHDELKQTTHAPDEGKENDLSGEHDEEVLRRASGA